MMTEFESSAFSFESSADHLERVKKGIAEDYAAGWRPAAFGGAAAAHANTAAATDSDEQVEEAAGPSPGVKIQTSREFTDSLTPPEYVVDGLIQRAYLYSTTALTGHGKTAVALFLAYCIGTGKPFGPHEVEQGRVTYFAGENPEDVKARWKIMADVLGFDLDTIPVSFISDPFDITTAYSTIKEHLEVHGDALCIIVDTAAAFFDGDDENSNRQQTQFAQNLRTLTQMPGKPVVLVTSHPVKSASRDNLLPRGGGAFVNAVDGNLTLWSEDRQTTELSWQGKIRGADFEPLSFHLKRIDSETVKDSKGRRMPSIMAVPMSEAEIEIQKTSIRSDEDNLLETMFLNPRESQSMWAELSGWTWVDKDGKRKPYKSKVNRVLGRLKDAGLAKPYRGDWNLTDKGKKDGERIAQETGNFKGKE